MLLLVEFHANVNVNVNVNVGGFIFLVEFHACVCLYILHPLLPLWPLHYHNVPYYTHHNAFKFIFDFVY